LFARRLSSNTCIPSSPQLRFSRHPWRILFVEGQREVTPPQPSSPVFISKPHRALHHLPPAPRAKNMVTTHPSSADTIVQRGRHLGRSRDGKLLLVPPPMVPFRPEDVPPSPSPSYHFPRPPSAPLRDVVGLWLFLRLITGRTPSERRGVLSLWPAQFFPRVIVLPPPFGLRPVPPTSGGRSSSKFRQVFSHPSQPRQTHGRDMCRDGQEGAHLQVETRTQFADAPLLRSSPFTEGTRLIWVWRTPYASLEPLGFVLRWLLSLIVRDAAHDKT